MARANFQAFAVDNKGNILSGAGVEVRDTNGALLAASAIFTGYTGSSTVASNPFTLGSDGLIQFYVEGSQVLTITATSGANTATWSNVVLNELFTPSNYALNSSLGTAAALNTGTASGELPTNGDLGTAAQADLTTSTTDTTTGRVLRVGDATRDYSTARYNSDLSQIDYSTPYLQLSTGVNVGSGADFSADYGNGDFIHNMKWDGNAAIQVLYKRANTPTVEIRAKTGGAWRAPVEFWTTGNLTKGTGATDVPTNSDLGTAAQADVTTSNTDTTASRALRVGDGGLLGFSQDVSDYSTPEAGLGRIYRESSSTSGGEGSGFWGCISLPMAGNYANGSMQSAVIKANATELRFGRKVAGNSNPSFIGVWTDNNYQPENSLGSGVSRKMKNKSGGAIADQGTIAGSSLKAVFTDSSGVEQESAVSVGGTWVNVSGMSIGNNEAAEFTKL